MSLEISALNYFTLPAGVSNVPLCAITIFLHTFKQPSQSYYITAFCYPRVIENHSSFFSPQNVCVSYIVCISPDLLPSMKCGVELHLCPFVLELSVNGELDSLANGGFKKIVIHFKTDQYVEVDTDAIFVRDGQSVTNLSGDDLTTAGR